MIHKTLSKTLFTLLLSLSVTVAVDAKDGGKSKKKGDQSSAKSESASKKKYSYSKTVPKPTLYEVSYGPHERHVLDFWKAPSETPTPLVFVVHGGGWVGGGKERLSKFVNTSSLLKEGISVVAISYRLLQYAKEVKPPVKAPMEDAARALQFVRSKAKEWNIDKTRIGASGSSAGGCTSLWLAFHDDLAEPTSDDPIARESTRLSCVAVTVPQTSLDPKQMREWMPTIGYGAHAFGIKGFSKFLEERESIMPLIKEYSPYELVSSDDPPVYLHYFAPPAMGQKVKDPTHSSNFGVKFQEQCKKIGVKCDIYYPEGDDKKSKSKAVSDGQKYNTKYLITALKAKK